MEKLGHWVGKANVRLYPIFLISESSTRLPLSGKRDRTLEPRREFLTLRHKGEHQETHTERVTTLAV